MDKTLNRFDRRRLAWMLGCCIAAALLVLAAAVLHTALRPMALYSGILLLALVIGLACFNARKKLPFLPLARASTWLQIHIYAGWLTVVVFLFHAGWRWHGPLGLLLGCAFALVAGSGVVGLILSRWVPLLLVRSGEAVTYERIPEFRSEVRARVEELVIAADRESESSTLGEFHMGYLMPYVDARPALWPAFDGQDHSYRRTVEELNSLERYFNAREREVAVQLREWIEVKRNLDNQLVGQRLLKYWLFLHIPATSALLILALVHAVVALRYSAGF